MKNGASSSWQKRLTNAQRAGNLTVADLARWFDRPHATVRSWVCDGVEPGGGPLDVEHARALLGLLETLIAKRKGFSLDPAQPRKVQRARLADLRRAMLPVQVR